MRVTLYVSPRVDQAVRSLLILGRESAGKLHGAEIAQAQNVAPYLITDTLGRLRRAGLITSARGGRESGYRIARSLERITLAEVFSALQINVAEFGPAPSQSAPLADSAMHLQEVWVALVASLQEVLKQTTLAHVATGEFPEQVRRLAASQI
jgi:Rrf2 family protein